MIETINVNRDDEGNLYSNESVLKGILHHSKFDGGYDPINGFTDYIIGGGSRKEIIKKLGFSDNPTEAECRSKMKSFKLNAYPNFTFTLHKDLESEAQQIYNELKELGVELNKYQGHYCFRPINNPSKKGSKTLSMHSFGCAIDLNYNLNPFVRNGKPLSSGDNTKKGIVRTLDSPIVKIFEKYGWGWGGRYGDYMHFSKANGG